jgi:hypothetical protein
MSDMAVSERRPGWVTFASVMMFVIGGVHAVWAINEFADAAWVTDVSGGILGDNLWFWGLWDLVMTCLLVYAGWDLLKGTGRVGRWIAVVVAGVGIVRWLYWLPFAPTMGIAMLILATLVIYGVVANWAYFDRR